MSKPSTFGTGLAVVALALVAGLGWLATAGAQDGGAGPVQWEYEVISTLEIQFEANKNGRQPDAEDANGKVGQFNERAEVIEDRLDALGNRGWELVQVDQMMIYLKRPARQGGMR